MNASTRRSARPAMISPHSTTTSTGRTTNASGRLNSDTPTSVPPRAAQGADRSSCAITHSTRPPSTSVVFSVSVIGIRAYQNHAASVRSSSAVTAAATVA